jgi:molybdenum cofactor cytidylyltransferase
VSDAGEMAAVILAAGAGSRFGGGKVRAALDGRPLVAHVLGAVRDAGIRRVVVVLGRDAGAVLGAVRAIEPSALDGVLVTINPAPERGLATSLRLGFGPGAAPPVPAGVLFLLADQPRVRASVVRELCAARVPAGTIAVAPSYSGDAAPNPVLLLPGGWPLVAGAAGDRGLGPLLTADPARVVRVAVSGTNPDVDTPGDLAALAGPGASHAAPAASHAAPGASHAAPAAGPPALGPTGPSNRTPHSTEEAQ